MDFQAPDFTLEEYHLLLSTLVDSFESYYIKFLP